MFICFDTNLGSVVSGCERVVESEIHKNVFVGAVQTELGDWVVISAHVNRNFHASKMIRNSLKIKIIDTYL